ncbi:DUF1415 domain-containing protein [Pseudorhodoferax sp.]|uniref:DUF1415 domain-containing protein n=1 Tax=Pseudorhodoferax sp. TaxID=1993553 RepID=UPI002DD695ED|nr:DUF1415 domain-containing protein [Pseudorhodoferax sp.]
MDEQTVLADTQRWLQRAVIGLNLCPFAKAVVVKQQLRCVVSAAQTPEALAEALLAELQHLAAADPGQTDTTLLIHPQVLGDFDDYNQFLDVADALVAELGLEGELQVASFHPDYRFADAEPDDVAQCSNRSPYPMLHLLREASIERALESYPDAEGIYERNIDTLRRLGWPGWHALWAD